MSIKRYAARRDSNEPELVQAARKLGWSMTQLSTPCDWLGCFRGVWWPIEVKRPELEGKSKEYTPAQLKWRESVARHGGRIITWRTEQDVIASSQTSKSP